MYHCLALIVKHEEVWRTWARIVSGDHSLIENDRGDNITFTRLVARRNNVQAG